MNEETKKATAVEVKAAPANMLKNKNNILRLLPFILPAGLIFAAFFFKQAPAGIILLVLWIGYAIYVNRALYYSNRANVAYTKGDLEGAISWLKKACDMKNGKAEYSIVRAYLLLKSGKLQEAEEIFEGLQKSDISEVDRYKVQSNMALVLWKKGQIQDAINTLEELLPNYTNTSLYGSLGYLLIISGDYDKALKFNLEACDYNGENSIILDNLGQTYFLRGELDKAREIYDRLIPKNPAFGEAYLNFSHVLEAQGYIENALTAARKAKNYKLTFLSAISEEEVDRRIAMLEKLSNQNSDEIL